MNVKLILSAITEATSPHWRLIKYSLFPPLGLAIFHILTPYPRTRLYTKLTGGNRIISNDWNRYDTRHSVFQRRLLTIAQLEKGYQDSYRDFYKMSSIFKSAIPKKSHTQKIKHLAYTGAWKKLEFMWYLVIKLKLTGTFLPVLESLLNFEVLKIPKISAKKGGKLLQLDVDRKIRA